MLARGDGRSPKTRSKPRSNRSGDRASSVARSPSVSAGCGEGWLRLPQQTAV
ncbi:MAG: hypothetical protein WBA89_05445 [Microcoleus sp.]